MPLNKRVILPLCAALTVAAFAAHAADPLPGDVRLGTSEQSGPIFTTAAGMTLYSTTQDETASGKPGCGNARFDVGTHHLGEKYPLSDSQKARQKTCLEKWPPFIPSASAAPTGKWAIMSRDEGFKQWTYDGRPLYLSSKDQKPGDVGGLSNGGRGGGWRVETAPLGFPPGVKLVRTVDGLMIANKSDQIFFAPQRAGAKIGEGWLPVAAPMLTIASGDWRPVEQPDGTRQWAYKGQALYVPDTGTGPEQIRAAMAKKDVQPVAFQRAKAPPPGIQMQYTLAGWVYADAGGKTLYTFSCNDETEAHLPCEQVGDPAIYRSSICGTGADCARDWRPVLAPANAVRAGDWDVRDVPDPPFVDAAAGYGENVPMVRGWTYRGHPVYTFTADRSPGDINGHIIRYYGVSRFSIVKVLGNTYDDGERHFQDD